MWIGNRDTESVFQLNPCLKGRGVHDGESGVRFGDRSDGSGVFAWGGSGGTGGGGGGEGGGSSVSSDGGREEPLYIRSRKDEGVSNRCEGGRRLFLAGLDYACSSA